MDKQMMKTLAEALIHSKMASVDTQSSNEGVHSLRDLQEKEQEKWGMGSFQNRSEKSGMIAVCRALMEKVEFSTIYLYDMGE